MDEAAPSKEARTIADFIRGLNQFTLVERGEPYHHMGATITDAILQAGMRYEIQVWPRVQRILTDHPDACTTSGFRQLLAERTPEAIVGINGRKALWVQLLAAFLAAQNVETEDDLRAWLADPAREQYLFQLKGVGLKTVNYLKLLVGVTESVAVDTHIRAFLKSAGVSPQDDRDAGRIAAEAAALVGCTPAQLDISIWTYQTRLAKRNRKASGK
jgi:hypothetical protein